MAGIGFVLQKVLKEGGLFSYVKVALAGTIIVAGPWLLSIIGIFIIKKYAGGMITESSGLFTGVIIYSYAVSLFIFGGSHYVFTRQVADLIYEDKNRAAGASLLLFSIVITVLAVLIGFFAFLKIDLAGMSHPLMFKLGGIMLFAVINLIWLLMIFISLLKKYILIFLVYLTGMGLSFLGVYQLGKIFSTGGAMIGFTLGQLFIVIALYIMSLLEYRPGVLDVKSFLWYFKKFRYLFLSGLMYYWGMWIDKFVFWFTKGTRVENSFFRVFDLYDIPVYLANLTIIPGLLFFMIISETSFHNSLMEFLNSVHRTIYKQILTKKYALIACLKKGILDQSLFQGIFTFILILVTTSLTKYSFFSAVDVVVMRITLVAVFFHLLFLTLTIYLFYMQLFKFTFFLTLCFFLINLAGSIMTVLSGNDNLLGISFMAAGIICSALAYFLLLPSLRKYDRIIFIQSARGE